MSDSRPMHTTSPSAASMFARDIASQSLGICVLHADAGTAVLRMKVRPDMVNGHAMCHGGYVFLLADTAFAFACNSHGPATIAAAASIEFLRSVPEGDELTATAAERRRGRSAGVYDVEVHDSAGRLVALFRGRSHEIGDGG